MKLLKCHIENFGKLQNYNYTFDRSYNIVNEQNGWGKTTFASFIKAMFYGMPVTTKQDLNQNERKKYTPWQGGNYGGYIEFSVGEDCYRIERFFGKKASEDIFNLIDLKTGKKSVDYSSNIGEELFELDSEAYERCTYIPQKELSGGINDKLSSKLINIIHGTENSESLEKALEIIDLKRCELKKKNNTGKLPEVEAQIEQTTSKIDAFKTSVVSVEEMQNSVAQINLEIDNLEQKKQEVQNQISDYAKKEKVIANKRFLEQTKAIAGQLEQKISVSNKILNGNKINKRELFEINDLINQTALDKSRYETLKGQTKDSERLEELQNALSGKVISEKQVEELMQINENINTYRAELSAVGAQKTQNNNGKRKKIEMIPLCLALVAVVLGAVFISSNMIAGIVCFAIAVALALVGVVIYMKAFINAKFTQNVKNDANTVHLLRDKQQYIEENTLKLNAFLQKYNYNGQNITVFLSEIFLQIKEFNTLAEKVEIQALELDKLNAKIQNSKNKIDGYLSVFNFEEGLDDSQKTQVLESITQSLDKEIEELNAYKQKIQEFAVNDEEQENLQQVDIESLQAKEKNVQNEIDDKKELLLQTINKINSINEQVSELNELEEHLVLLKEQKKEYSKELKMVKYASDFLTKANDNLSAKYLKPMKDGLNKYLSLILKGELGELNLDTNLNINFETFGQSRTTEYLSKGYQGVVDLCVRFALIDTLFTKEKPFVILDDPFVNMDKEKMQKAIELVKQVAKDYQIVYFICHEARA